MSLVCFETKAYKRGGGGGGGGQGRKKNKSRTRTGTSIMFCQKICSHVAFFLVDMSK